MLLESQAMAVNTSEFAESGRHGRAFRSPSKRPLDDLCEMAARLFDVPAACILLKQGGLSRIVASCGLPVQMRSSAWDFAKAPYGREDLHVVPDATHDSFVHTLFHELGLKVPGSLVRAPVANADDYSVSLLVLGDKPIAKPTAKKLKLLSEVTTLVREEFKTVERLLTDSTNDVTVARSLAEVHLLVQASPFAAFLLDDHEHHFRQ